MTVSPLPTPTALPAGKTVENRPRQVSNDSFASLTGLMKSKKPWTVAPKPKIQSLISVPTNGLSQSASKLAVRHLEKPSGSSLSRTHSTGKENGFNAPTPFQPQHALCLLDSGTATVETPPSSPPAREQGYDEAVMKRMEDMVAEMRNMNTDESSEWEAVSKAPSDQQLDSPTPTLAGPNKAQKASSKQHGKDTFRLPLTPSPSSSLSDHDEPIVRVTQAVWDNMMDQMAKLKKDKLDALAKLSTLEREEHLRRQTKGDNSSELDQLRYRLEVNQDYKAAMSRDIRQKDAEICKKELEIEDLRKQVVEMDVVRKQVEQLHAEIHYLRVEAEQKGADAGSFTQLIEFKDQEITRLKEVIHRIQGQLSSHQTRADNLAETQAAREKKLRQTKQQLETIEDSKERLLDDLDNFKTQIAPLKSKLKDLELQLREKTSSCDRMRNDLRHTERRLEITNKALHKVENHLHLKGAAHPIVPSDTTKLPRLVLPCMECFAKNIPCDSNSRCQNCLVHGEKCLRWKCSQMHILRDGCQEFPCMLNHDQNGWLMLKQDQPQW
ncbi:hypothetical protein BU23DRAFT_188465 [Bimuria novae-zelandiae CBS 107.79]|uniref:Uncharacterized protein n=1 Tax=Bimuria novae-zelandiae CBS 107.79 TaxID=1447943 RepID=A0A6A5VN93_9PLEO|nr:hypothetical protein BU23DRAFT_188465 [Bimuria novae-zelandiae CBS 107.79]